MSVEELEKKIKNQEKTIQDLVKKLYLLREEKSSAQDKIECDLCTTNHVNLGLIPCGHTLCHKCYKQLNKNNVLKGKCCFCKRAIRGSLELFFT